MGYLLDEWVVTDGGKLMSNIMSLLSFLFLFFFLFFAVGATDSFGRVTQRERQRLLMALLKEMECNLVLIHRYSFVFSAFLLSFVLFGISNCLREFF